MNTQILPDSMEEYAHLVIIYYWCLLMLNIYGYVIEPIVNGPHIVWINSCRQIPMENLWDVSR